MREAAYLVLVGLATAAMGAPEPVVQLAGTDFAGGASSLFGEVQSGVGRVNYVYAAPTGAYSRMRAAFELTETPSVPVMLYLYARDDDSPDACPIRISLNEEVIFAGPSAFPGDAYAWCTYPVPNDALEAGENVLLVENTAREGRLGMPPWFMVARAVFAAADFDPSAPPPFEENAYVKLPTEARPIPEPLNKGQQPGFTLRGTKGWLWSPEQYLAEVPVLAAFKMNFLMICYGSMCDIEHYPWGDPRCNRWWEPLPNEKRAAYEDVLDACQSAGIELCLSMNPNLSSDRALDYDARDDFEALWQHYAWMQNNGMRWFCLSLDDITRGIDASGQARLSNRLFERLRKGDPEAQLILCPTYYWGDGADPPAAAYLDVLAHELDPGIFVFWTGGGVVGRITRQAAESYGGRVGHRLIIWDNYPVNDGHPTLHLGPVTGRDPDLAQVCYGYMSNPMHKENELNRIPLATCADYAYNPQAYDARRSIGQAIIHLAETSDQRAVLRDLVELYPGMLVYGKGPNWNPVLSRFGEILGMRHARFLAKAFLEHVETVVGRFEICFPDRYAAGKATLCKNIAAMREMYNAAYPH
jgi:hypothetical protein